MTLRVALCVLLGAGLAVGCGSGSLPAETVGPSAVPTEAASPTDSLTGAASPQALGRRERALEAGTYLLDLDLLHAGGAEFPPIVITVPEGWIGGGWFINRPRPGEDTPPVALLFWDVDQVYGHPCEWDGTLFDPGPTVEDLASALVDVPLRNATQPIDVTLDGYAGTYLEWSVPADIDFSGCDADGGEHYFESWTGKGWATDRYQQGPGQVDRLWILDVDGARLVIDAFSMPYATSEEIEELVDVVESITFER